jgi:hypothetical protein
LYSETLCAKHLPNGKKRSENKSVHLKKEKSFKVKIRELKRLCSWNRIPEKKWHHNLSRCYQEMRFLHCLSYFRTRVVN